MFRPEKLQRKSKGKESDIDKAKAAKQAGTFADQHKAGEPGEESGSEEKPIPIPV